jgi:hypothetical protein
MQEKRIIRNGENRKISFRQGYRLTVSRQESCLFLAVHSFTEINITNFVRKKKKCVKGVWQREHLASAEVMKFEKEKNRSVSTNKADPC